MYNQCNLYNSIVCHFPFCTFSTESKPSTLTSIRDVDDILMVAGLNVGYRVYILMISLEEILFNVGAWMTVGNLCKEIRNFGDRNGPICHQHLCTAICRQHLCSWILMTHFYDLSLFNPSLLPRLSLTTTLTGFLKVCYSKFYFDTIVWWFNIGDNNGMYKMNNLINLNFHPI